MSAKYEVQCAVRGCATKRGRKENVPIHLFPKRGHAGQRWIEACANPYLSGLEYLQVVERKSFVCHRHFDEKWSYKKRNGISLLKYGAIPTLNLPSGSYVSYESDVNVKPAAVSSPSTSTILMSTLEAPAEGIRDFGESSVQFAHVSSNILNLI